MLKRLRLQFVAVIMVIVTIMLCTVFGMLYFFTRSSLEQESFAMMRAVPVGIMAPDRPLAPFARPGEQQEQVWDIMTCLLEKPLTKLFCRN